MNIQHLRDLNNHFININLDKNNIDEPLAKEIVDFYLQPLPINIYMYGSMMKHPQAETNNRIDVLTGVLENIVMTGNTEQYSNPYADSMDKIRTFDTFKALSLKYADLTKHQFDDELEILSRKQSHSPFIDNHYKQIHFMASEVYEWKFGIEPLITPVKSSYSGTIEFEEYSDYLKDFMINKTASLYSSQEIKELIRENSIQREATESVIDYHKNVLSGDYVRDSKRHNSEDFLKNVSFKEIDFEGSVYQLALFSSASLTENMDLIKAINNPDLNKVISTMRIRGELKPSHLNMVIDAYSGNHDPSVLIESYRNEFNKPSEDPAYYKNGIKLLIAVINDPNKASLDPNVNPYLIIEGKTIDSLSADSLVSRTTKLMNNGSNNEKLINSVYNMIEAERTNLQENTVANIIVKHMNDNDVDNAMSSLNSQVISNIAERSSLNIEDKKDIIRGIFAIHHEYDRLSDKHSLAIPENIDQTKHYSLASLFSIMKIDPEGSQPKDMEVVLKSFVNNNSDEKIGAVYDEISSMKDSNKLSSFTLASIDKCLLEKAAPAEEETLISRIKRKFS